MDGRWSGRGAISRRRTRRGTTYRCAKKGAGHLLDGPRLLLLLTGRAHKIPDWLPLTGSAHDVASAPLLLGGPWLLVRGARTRHRATMHAPPRINVPPRRTSTAPSLVESCSSEEHGCATEDHACSSEDQRSSSDEHRCSWVAPRCSSEEEPTFSKAQYVGTRTQAGTANGVNACSPDRPRGAATRERTAEMRRRISSMVGRGPPYGRIANARGSATIVA